MKKSLITIIVLLLTLSMYTQSKINGKVVYLNSGKQPALGVEISAKGSSGSSSKEKGQFILNFPSLKAGATVYPKIGNEIVVNGKISTIELVNTERLKSFSLPLDPTLDSLKIIVCPRGFRDEAAKRYYNIIRTETSEILVQKKKEIDGLKEKLGNFHNLVIEKQKELDKLREQNKDTIVTYKRALDIASINRDDATQRVKNFLDALDVGLNIEEALKELSTKKAYEEALKAGNNIDASIEEIERNAASLVDVFKFEQAIQKYDTINIILRNDRFNPRLLMNNLSITGGLCADQKFLTQAENHYQEILRIHKDQGYDIKDETYYGILINLGLLYVDKYEFTLALANYQEALKILRELAKEDPKTYLSHLALIIRNLGVLLEYRKEFQQANKKYQEAIEIYRELAKENPKTYLSDVASSLNDIAILQSINNELLKSTKTHQEALSIYRKLVKESPEKYLPDLAMSLHNLSIAQSLDGSQLPEAIANNQEALIIRRDFAKKNPKKYLAKLASTLNNLGSLQIENNELPQAFNNLQEALKIRRELALDNPKVFLPKVVQTLSNLRSLQAEKNESSKVLSNIQETLKIIKELAAGNPEVFLPELADTFSDLADIQVNNNEDLKATSNYQEALKIYRELSKGNNYLSVIGITLEFLGDLQSDNNKLPEAIKNYKEASDIFSNLAKENPEQYLSYAASNLGSLAWCALLNKDFILAETSAKKGLELSPDEEWINTNLVLAYVLQDKYEMAKIIYIKLKDKPYDDSFYSSVFIEDIITLEESGIIHKDFQRIKILLQN